MEANLEMDRAQAPPEEPMRAPSLVVRVLQLFHAPGRLFDALRADPRWGGALFLGGVFAALSVLLVPADIWEQGMREQILSSGAQVPEGFSMGGVARIATAAGGTLFWFVYSFFLTGVATVLFGFLLGDDGRFIQYLSVVAHAMLVGAIGSLLLVPLRIVQSDPQLTLNLALFVPVESVAYGVRVLRMLDLFMLWSFVMMGLGVSRIDPRRSWGSAAALLLALAVCMAMVFAIFIPAV